MFKAFVTYPFHKSGNSNPDGTEATLQRQTLVFTATLSNALRFDRKKKKSKKGKSPSSDGTMGRLRARLHPKKCIFLTLSEIRCYYRQIRVEQKGPCNY